MPDSLQPHEFQHARPPCPSPTPGVERLTSIKLVMPSSHLILYCPLLLLAPIPPSIRVFSNESTLPMRWPKYWSFSFSISPSKICQQIWKTQQWPQDWKRAVFIPIPKNGNAKECSHYHIITLISHASKVMLKILQGRLQQYVNHELPNVQAGF